MTDHTAALGLPKSVAEGRTPDIVRQAITQYPKEAAEFLSTHFPAVSAYSDIEYARRQAVEALRQPVDGLTEAVKHQAALARHNAALVKSMVADGDFDDIPAGTKQDAIVDLVIVAEQLEHAATDAKDASNEILARNVED